MGQREAAAPIFRGLCDHPRPRKNTSGRRRLSAVCQSCDPLPIRQNGIRRHGASAAICVTAPSTLGWIRERATPLHTWILRARGGRDNAGRPARIGRLAGRARGRGSRHGGDRAVLAAGVDALEQHWRSRRRVRDGAPPLSGTLHLAQAQSHRGPRDRKKDFPDAERSVKRLVAQELIVSVVPDATSSAVRPR